MLIPFIHGYESSVIGEDEIFDKCPSCETNTNANIIVSSRYYHLYHIPLVPVDKLVNIYCKKCGLKRMLLPFNGKTVSNYEDIKSKFKHPLRSGIILYGFLLFIFLAMVLRNGY
jgi:hypothetical protein